MDLILWRHAEAVELQDGCDDLDRTLTARGYKQAIRMASWLDRQLPESTRIVSSPARRCEDMVRRLDRKYKLSNELLPQASASQVLQSLQWPTAKATVLVVGHQPMIGQIVAELLGLHASECAIRKGAVWWFRSREREGQRQTVLVTVQSADML
ncbi:MAG: histidine phosphatase family protein [Burkholderiaceae bacterium]|nr:histidine phosphatase family protein [Burkholderiaceae bacterium]